MIAFTLKDCRFKSALPISAGVEIYCALYHSNHEYLQHVTARTHWCQKIGNKWQVGAIFNEDLDNVFAAPAANERRSRLRYEARQSAVLQTCSGSEYPVHLKDYSLEGACVTAKQPLPPCVGKQIQIRLPQNDAILSGHVAWQLGTDDGGQAMGVKVLDAELIWFTAAGDYDASQVLLNRLKGQRDE